jgi:hypothetical protein
MNSNKHVRSVLALLLPALALGLPVIAAAQQLTVPTQVDALSTSVPIRLQTGLNPLNLPIAGSFKQGSLMPGRLGYGLELSQSRSPGDPVARPEFGGYLSYQLVPNFLTAKSAVRYGQAAGREGLKMDLGLGASYALGRSTLLGASLTTSIASPAMPADAAMGYSSAQGPGLRDAYAADVRLGLSLTGMLGKQWGYFADLEASRNFGVLKDTSLIPGRSAGSASIGLTYHFQ